MGVEPTPHFLDEANGFAARGAPGAIAPKTLLIFAVTVIDIIYMSN